MITVFTPSYNRKKELKKLYKSLLTQKNVDFEWLIVDDGSSDNTSEYINQIKQQKEIKITYIYKINGGKQSAYNLGLDKANGNIFLCIDSDDILKNNILRTIEDDFMKIKNIDDIAGIMYLQGYLDKKKNIIGTKFPIDKQVDTYYNIYNKHNVRGDKLIILKTEVARKYYFPIIEGEKFVAEALIFNRISLKYKFMCRNIITSYKEYLENGYSNNYFNLVKKNPMGNALYFRELYNFKSSLYNVYGYVLFNLYGKKNFVYILKKHPAKIKILLLYIPTKIISFIKR